MLAKREADGNHSEDEKERGRFHKGKAERSLPGIPLFILGVIAKKTLAIMLKVFSFAGFYPAPIGGNDFSGSPSLYFNLLFVSFSGYDLSNLSLTSWFITWSTLLSGDYL